MTRVAIVVLAATLAVSGCAARRAASPPPVDTTNRWAVASPASEGMNAALLRKADAYVTAHLPYVTSLLVVRHGVIVSERYFHSNARVRDDVQSVTKSVVSALVGVAVQQHRLSLDETLGDLLPRGDIPASADPRVRSITLRDLLTMRGGWIGDLGSGDFGYTTTLNWARALVDRPMFADPGTHFDYDSGTAHLVSLALRHATGRSTFANARQELFTPIGIRDADWLTDMQGNDIGGWGLQLTARDLARLGYLYLRDGRWDGRQVVPATWVRESTAAQVQTGGTLGGWGYPPWRSYGYFWWRYPLPGAFMAFGLGGQFIGVWPKLDLVVVTTAIVHGGQWDLRDTVERYIVPAVKR